MKHIETPGFRKIVSPQDQEIQLIPVEGREEIPQTIKDLLELYQRTIKPADFSATLSTLTRYGVPAIEGPSPKSSRASSEEIEAALKFLEKKSIWLMDELEEKQEKYFEKVKVPADKRYLPRSILKKLIDWARKQGFLTQKASKKEISIYRHTRVSSAPPQKTKTSNSCRLGSKNEHFVRSNNWKPLSTKEAKDWQQRFVTSVIPLIHSYSVLVAVAWIEIAKILPPLFLVNPILDGEIIRLINFLQKEMTQAFETTNRDINTILRCLEFLYREEYQHKPEQLSLTSIIPDLPTPDSIRISQFRNKAQPGEALWIAKASAEEEMLQAISQMEETVCNYLDSLTVAFNSQVNYLKSFINLAKFIYFKQTKNFEKEGGYEDIELIKALRKIQNQKSEQSVTSGQKTESRKRRREKMVPWPKILLAVEMAVMKFEEKYKYGVNTKTRYKNGSPRISMAIRSTGAQFRDLQTALILAMATALPPTRSKVYYQMEIGKNLIKGKLINGVLVRIEDLPEDQKNLATWWLYLSPPDGKKDTIGEEGWQAEIPNRKFSTGKTLYCYLEDWINNWRPKLSPKHDFLYITEEGNELTTSTYGNKVRNAFRRFIGSPVNPHLLRHILITYAYDRGISDAEKRSLAKCQQHSEETQAKIYNEQEMLNSLQPALKLNQKFLDEFYQSFAPEQIDPT
jgi:hypothetical protein